MSKAYGLYLSYNRWLHQLPLDVCEHIEVADETETDPAELDEQWSEGCFPEGDEIITPDADDEEDG
jgi:hypothetical protein